MIDHLVDLVLEIADLLGALVLHADEADPHGRRRHRAGRLTADRRLQWRASKLRDRFVDQRLEGLGPGLVAADHVRFARFLHPGELIAAAAGGGHAATGPLARHARIVCGP